MSRKLLFTFLVCAATNVAAHDFWLEPSSFSPKSDAPVAIRFMVGDDFTGEPARRNNPRIERFVVRDANGERVVGGANGGDPAGVIDGVEGAATIGYRSRPVRHGDMTPAKFQAYLREEGLEHVIDARAKSGASNAAGREIYSRSAKAFVGRGDGARREEPLGFRLELVPENDPQSSAPLGVRVLFEGRPVANVLVSALRRGTNKRTSVRTDNNGRVSFDLGKGRWLIKTVHMIPAPQGSDADWESIWATMTFEK